jgi:outer membrane protein assembly factor BamB
MNHSHLIFVGGASRLTALRIDSGEVVWEVSLSPKQVFRTECDLVSVLDTGDALFACTRGHVFRIDPLSGRILWERPLKHLKHHPASLNSKGCSSTGQDALAGSEFLERRISD